MMLAAPWLQSQSGEYFEGTRFFAWQPGRTQPKEWMGYLMVNATAEKLNFYSDHMNLVEIPFRDLGSMRYEFAAQPQGVELPPKGWPRMKKKAQKHLLTIVYRETRRAPAQGGAVAAEAMATIPATAVFELPKEKYEAVLDALEAATERSVERPAAR